MSNVRAQLALSCGYDRFRGARRGVSLSAMDGCDLVVRLGSNVVSFAGLVAEPLGPAAPLAAGMHH